MRFPCILFTAPLGDIQLSNHVSCSCLGLTRRDFCNRSEALHFLRSTAKSEITVSRRRYQNEAQKKHCRSRRVHHLLISFLDFDSPLRLDFILSPLPLFFMLCHSITVKGRSLSTQQGRRMGKYFYINRVTAVFGSNNCFAPKYSPKAEISHQYRRRVADQLSGDKTVVDIEKPRQKGAILLFAKPLAGASVWQPPHQIFAATNALWQIE